MNCRLKQRVPFRAVGLSLQGIDDTTSDDVKARILQALRKDFPELSASYCIGNDIAGILASVQSGSTGIVVTAGVGSGCALIGGDHGQILAQSGGWGHLLSDEGSAFWITQRALKLVFDDADGYREAPHSCACVRRLLFTYFNVGSRRELLQHLYGPKFSKCAVAGAAKVLAEQGAIALKVVCFFMLEK